MNGISSRTSRYVTALVFSIIVEIVFFIQPIANSALLLGRSEFYLYTNNEYSYAAGVIWPFLAGLAYYIVTGEKRLWFPLVVQLGTVATTTVILIADTVQPTNSSLIVRSLTGFLELFLTLTLVSAFLLAFLGVFQVLGLRVVLGMEVRGQPDTVSFTVDLPFEAVLVGVDDEFIESKGLLRRDTEVEDVRLFSTTRNTGDEVALAVGRIDDQTTAVAISAVRVIGLYARRSERAVRIMNGLARDFRDRFSILDPPRIFTDIPTRDNPTSRVAVSYSLRATKTSFSRLSAVIAKSLRRVRIRTRVNIPIGYVVIAVGATILGVVVWKINPPNVVEIEAGIILGLLLDLGIAIQQSREKGRASAS